MFMDCKFKKTGMFLPAVGRLTKQKQADKVARFCSMCGPKVCSMRIGHDIRTGAQKEGTAAMAEKFREDGEFHLPLEDAQ